MALGTTVAVWPALRKRVAIAFRVAIAWVRVGTNPVVCLALVAFCIAPALFFGLLNCKHVLSIAQRYQRPPVVFWQ